MLMKKIDRCLELLEEIRKVLEEDATPGAKDGWVYILQLDGKACKIGRTTKLDDRIRNLGTKLPYEPELIHTIETNDIHWAERHLHRFFQNKRIRGEWFNLTEEDIAMLKKLDRLVTWDPNPEAFWPTIIHPEPGGRIDL